MPTHPLNTFLTALVALVNTVPAVQDVHKGPVDHTLIPDNKWPYVSVFEGAARVNDHLSMAVDHDHDINVWVYARTPDECRSVHEAIEDLVNADKRVGNTALNCWPVTLSATYGMDEHGQRYLKIATYVAKLRRLIP